LTLTSEYARLDLKESRPHAVRYTLQIDQRQEINRLELSINGRRPAKLCATGFGTLGRGVVYGPGQHNMDMSIFKDTKVGGLSEAGTVQFRTEFFNTFNTPQFASQTTTQFSTAITQRGAEFWQDHGNDGIAALDPIRD
jgi:hypothetical protein